MSGTDAHSLAASRIDHYLMQRMHGGPVSAGEPEPRVKPVITVSRTLGIAGAEIAALVARDLGFTLMDREVLDAVSQDTRLGERIVQSLDRGSLSALDSWFAGLVDYDHRVVDKHSFHHIVSRVVRGICYHGSAVILGRGANFILRGTSAFRVRLTAPTALRVQALLEATGPERCASPAEARHRLQEHAAQRKHFVAQHFHASIDDPEAYDVIFCLRRLDPEHAAHLISGAYRRAVEG